MDSVFPMPDGENRAICVPGVGSTKPFSVLAVDSMPDLHLVAFGQCFPRYRYQAPSDAKFNAPPSQSSEAEQQAGNASSSNAAFNAPPSLPLEAAGDTAARTLPAFQEQLPVLPDALQRFDNITDAALRKFRAHYRDPAITKDAVFDYAYGLLHAPDYRRRFANDLSKALPRIPLAEDFQAFAQAGNQLMALHLGYETCAEHPLELTFTGEGAPKAEHFPHRQAKDALRRRRQIHPNPQRPPPPDRHPRAGPPLRSQRQNPLRVANRPLPNHPGPPKAASSTTPTPTSTNPKTSSPPSAASST